MQTLKNFFTKHKIISTQNIKWLFLLILMIIVIIFISMRKDNDTIVIKNHDMYQYFNGFRVDYKGKIKINKSKDEIAKISFDGNDTELDSTPLYYADEKKVIFPEKMAVIFPLEGTQYKINYYSEAYIDFEEVVIKDKKLERRLFDSVIYDGNDLYFITEKSNVTFNNQKYEVSPLSYVIVDTLNKMVSIYDYEKDKFSEIENVTSDVIISNDKFRVNASLDLMYYSKSSRLFIKDISKLLNLPKK